MRRGRWLVLIVALAIGVFLAVPPRARTLPPPPAGLRPPARGVIHVHTRRSDGTGTVDDVAAAAARAGLQFVILTDHGDATRPPEPPSYRSGVLCIDAVEISTEGGHVVALGLPPAPYPLAGEPRDVIADIARLGGFSIAAHPVSARAESRWSDWTAPFDGLEWLNGDSEWRDEPLWRLARVVFAYPFRKVETLGLLLDRSDALMERWDALTRRRRVVAVAAADAHARIGLPSGRDPYDNRLAVPVPGYEPLFRTFSIALPHVTLGANAEESAAAVLAEIRAGRVYSVVDAIAGPAAFAFSAASGSVRALAGEPLTIDGPVRLRVDVQAPPDVQISLLRDGTRVLDAAAPSLVYDAEPSAAVYRVEVRWPGVPGEPPVPWIVSNPIYVGQPEAEPAPAPRPPPTAATPIYMDGPATGWSLERSASSQAAFDVVNAVGGTQLMLRYALSGSAATSPFAALSGPAGPAIAGADRLTFRAQADRPMRLSVQLRAPGPGGAAERWHRSVFVDTTPREISVYFDELTPRSRTSAERPVLANVESVLFVVDTVNTPIGASGQVLLDDIRYGRR